ncbi:hypothetical protein Sme01_57280 [Sphaerisporangium melleum]|uniref:Bacterial Pleckstrin homology domain-containing protein n=1 Tax=Sphaerisporangium melleum TaxID=321316 RepID=A0A917VLZ9_9ACTN|nr:hypothetical protein [Sphaerisporangium melleum]GGK94532.1 hypothetical protein GCM10007964_41160 [Sphaerisporangium melleum]GII73252.1 hypothetical protein Sme01_57280 [Sphaerisporangium melleum]
MGFSQGAVALLPLIVLLGLLAVAVLRARNGDVARLDVGNDEIVIIPRGIFKLFAFTPRLRVPAGVLSAAYEIDPRSLGVPGMRMGATWFPGVVAGRFHSPQERSFWVWGKGDRAIRLSFDGWTYDYAVVEVADRESALNALSAVSRRNAVGN